MDALFTFAVGFTDHRPIRPDEHTSFVTLVGEDSARGLSEARWTAIAMVSGINNAEMVTSTALVAVEL